MENDSDDLPLRLPDGRLQHLLRTASATRGRRRPLFARLRLLRIPSNALDHGGSRAGKAGVYNFQVSVQAVPFPYV